MNSNITQTAEKDFVYEWNDIHCNEGASVDVYAVDGDDTNIRVTLDDHWGWCMDDVCLFTGLAIINSNERESTYKHTLPRSIQAKTYVKKDALKIYDPDDLETFMYWISGGNTRWHYTSESYSNFYEDHVYSINHDTDTLATFINGKSDDEKQKYFDLLYDKFNPSFKGFVDDLNNDWFDVDSLIDDIFGDEQYASLEKIINEISGIKYGVEETWFTYAQYELMNAHGDVFDELGWALEYRILTYINPNQTTILELIDEVTNE